MMDFRSNEADRIVPKSMFEVALPVELTFPAITHLPLVVTTQARGSWSIAMDYAKPSDIASPNIGGSTAMVAHRPRSLTASKVLAS
jgi:hypothetical protein